jgi:hypothetical protein
MAERYGILAQVIGHHASGMVPPFEGDAMSIVGDMLILITSVLFVACFAIFTLFVVVTTRGFVARIKDGLTSGMRRPDFGAPVKP